MTQLNLNFWSRMYNLSRNISHATFGTRLCQMYSLLLWNSNITKGSLFYLVIIPLDCKRTVFFPIRKTKVKWTKSKSRIWNPALEKMTSLPFSTLGIQDISSNFEYSNMWGRWDLWIHIFSKSPELLCCWRTFRSITYSLCLRLVPRYLMEETSSCPVRSTIYLNMVIRKGICLWWNKN